METNALSKMLYATCPRGYVDENGKWANGAPTGSGTAADPLRIEYPGCWAMFVFDLHCGTATIIARLTNNNENVYPHKLIGEEPIYEIKSITFGPAQE
jgi:hypothetical protein